MILHMIAYKCQGFVQLYLIRVHDACSMYVNVSICMMYTYVRTLYKCKGA